MVNWSQSKKCFYEILCSVHSAQSLCRLICFFIFDPSICETFDHVQWRRSRSKTIVRNQLSKTNAWIVGSRTHLQRYLQFRSRIWKWLMLWKIIRSGINSISILNKWNVSLCLEEISKYCCALRGQRSFVTSLETLWLWYSNFLFRNTLWTKRNPNELVAGTCRKLVLLAYSLCCKTTVINAFVFINAHSSGF